MSVKRGSSGLSLMVAVNKPKGMSSHDVVNACRRIFGERRVGHTGTLDPMASGVLPICIGPATRLDKFIVGHDKTYIAEVSFGAATDTDDAEGEIIEQGSVPSHLFEEPFAEVAVKSLVGVHEQLPPRYSAIKVDGKKAYESARKGVDVPLEARSVEIYDAELLGVGENDGVLTWTLSLSVSKGTYIRSIARDLGINLGCPAHLSALERTRSGNISKESCVSLESLENLKTLAALDPVRVLGCKFAFGDDIAASVENGKPLGESDVQVYYPLQLEGEEWICACSTSIEPYDGALEDEELVGIVVQNRLKGIYAYDAKRALLKPECIFNVGVLRG